MISHTLDPDKTEGFDGRNGRINKETTLLLRTGHTVAVADCSWSIDNSLLLVYYNDEQGTGTYVPREHIEMMLMPRGARGSDVR